ncbi:MAG: arylsulfotransferase family protein [Candidatus Altiarchaeota archaeon]
MRLVCFVLIVLFSGCLAADQQASNGGPSLLETRLKSLGYVDHVEEEQSPVNTGVTLYNPYLSVKGLNLFTPFMTSEAYLMDMGGEVVHSWSRDNIGVWEHVMLDGDGNLLAVPAPGELKNLMKLDSDSTPIWVKNGPYHHDVWASGGGRVYALSFKVIRNMSVAEGFGNLTDPYLMDKRIDAGIDVIEVFDNNGSLVDTISLMEPLAGYVPESKLREYVDLEVEDFVDVFHINTVEVLDRDIGVAGKGDIMVCSLLINMVAILDAETKEVLWSWGPGIIDSPHKPTLTEEGNILVFDNGARRNYSRVLEVDPADKSIVWEYARDPKNLFFSRTRGSAQPLPGGNVLISETNKGHVFEVTRDGEVVWEYWSPFFNDAGERRLIYRMTRITPEMLGGMRFEPGLRDKIHGAGYL